MLAKPKTVSKKYAGKWIAWNRRHTKIVASGSEFGRVRQVAIAAGERDPLLAKVPLANRWFIGGWQ